MRVYCSLIFLLSQYNVMSAKYNENNLRSFPVNPPVCTDLLNEFAEVASNFTRCSITHASPVRLCGKCIKEYVTFQEKYTELITKDANGTSCKLLIISHDRLDVVLGYHDDILAIWDKGNCNECFNLDDKGSPKIANNTLNFFVMYNETMDCINNNNTNSSNTKEVCEMCMPKYIKLDEFYTSLSIDGIGVDTVCMDIVDSMNATRYIWSKVHNCCSLRRSPEVVFLCCTAIIGILPLLFYIAVKYWGPIRDLPNVLKQSRFKQMILRSSERREN